MLSIARLTPIRFAGTPPWVLAAFAVLIQADDRLLAAEVVQRLIIHIGNVSPEVIDPIIQRMLGSDSTEAREAGAIAAFAALSGPLGLMQQAMSGDAQVRRGCARPLGL